MQGPLQQGVDLEMLRRVYSMQWDHRWRGSRNQDWGVIAIVTTLAVAALGVQYGPLGTQFWAVKVILPLLVAFASAVGLRILYLHQGVMNHANHIAKGIERCLNIHEMGGAQPPPVGRSTFVGFDGNDFKYPSKRAYLNEHPVPPFWFARAGNVQGAMAYFHLILIAGFLVFFFARVLVG